MCIIDDSDGPAVVLHDKKQVARKEHRCDECYRTIRAGETYRNECTVFDGSKETHKTCSHCEVVREWLTAECGGFIFGGVKEDIHEHASEGYGLRVRGLAAGMSQLWTRKDGRMCRIPKMPKFTFAKP